MRLMTFFQSMPAVFLTVLLPSLSAASDADGVKPDKREKPIRISIHITADPARIKPVLIPVRNSETFVVKDGHLIKVPPWTSKVAVPRVFHMSGYEKQELHEEAADAVPAAAAALTGYFVEASRMGEARTEAENRITKALNNGAKVAGVVVFADKPLDPSKEPGDGLADFLNHYGVSKLTTGSTKEDVIDGILGPALPTLVADDGTSSTEYQERYPRYMLVGYYNSKGSIVFDNVDRKQQESSLVRRLDAEAASQQAIRQEAEDGARAAEQAAKSEAEQKATEAEAERVRKAQEAEDAKQRQAAAERARDALKSALAERDEKCKSPNKTADCSSANEKVNSTVETSEKIGRTASCIPSAGDVILDCGRGLDDPTRRRLPANADKGLSSSFAAYQSKLAAKLERYSRTQFLKSGIDFRRISSP